METTEATDKPGAAVAAPYRDYSAYSEYARADTPHGRLVVFDVTGVLPRARESGMIFRPLRAITHIVVHWDDEVRPQTYDPVARYKAQARYHINKNWGTENDPVYGFGLMYHFKIAGDGSVWATEKLGLITWHARGGNNVSMGICVDCGWKQNPTPAQIASLQRLLWYLSNLRPDFPAGRGQVFGHGECKSVYGGGPSWGNNTTCPGPVLLERVRAFRKGQW